jgi:hypothetical protein
MARQYRKKDLFYLFDLIHLFPGHKLLVTISSSIVSLLTLDYDPDECVVIQRMLTEAQMRMLLPLLDAPACCEQEVLQASYACTYEFLLQSLVFSKKEVNPQWDELILAQRERLALASTKKAKRTEMRGVYNALFGLRQKLEHLGLTVRSSRDGYYLALLVER